LNKGSAGHAEYGILMRIKEAYHGLAQAYLLHAR